MAFNIGSNKTQIINVTDSGLDSITVLSSFPQVRIWNEGPDPCSIAIGTTGATAADDDLHLPAYFVEVYTKFSLTVVAAKCLTGKTAKLHVVIGTGD